MKSASEFLLIIAKHPKAFLFMVGAPFLSWMLISRGCNEMAKAPQSTPLLVSAEHFTRDYHGERWLTVDGQWASEHAWVSPVPNSEYNDYTNVFVPVVPDNWQIGDAVHAVAVFSEPTMNAARAWPAVHMGEHGPVTGCVAPDGVWDYHKMFPSLAMSDPITFIYVGQIPSSEDGKFDLWFGIGIGLAALFPILIVLANLMRRRKKATRRPM